MPRRGAIVDVPASVLLELAADPEAYKKMLDEISLRLTEAGEAESRASEASREAERKSAHNASAMEDLGRFKESLANREAKVVVIETQNGVDRSAIDSREKELDSREGAIALREASIDDRCAAALDACRALLKGN